MREPSSEEELLSWLKDVQEWGREEASDVSCETISYGDSPEQIVDLWRPVGPAPVDGLVVSLHGGSFSAEYAREIHEPLVRRLASRGLTVANVEYRRIGSGGGLRETTSDVERAISLLAERDEACGHGVALVGHSAGGYLALWSATRPDVDMTLALSPVADLRGWHESGLDEGYTALWMGATPSEDPDLYAAGSLLPRTAKDARICLLHGLLDETVPPALSIDFHRSVDQGVDSVTLQTLEDEGHYGWLDPRQPASEMVQERLLDWASGLNGPPESTG